MGADRARNGSGMRSVNCSEQGHSFARRGCRGGWNELFVIIRDSGYSSKYPELCLEILHLLTPNATPVPKLSAIYS